MDAAEEPSVAMRFIRNFLYRTEKILGIIQRVHFCLTISSFSVPDKSNKYIEIIAISLTCLRVTRASLIRPDNYYESHEHVTNSYGDFRKFYEFL